MRTNQCVHHINENQINWQKALKIIVEQKSEVKISLYIFLKSKINDSLRDNLCKNAVFWECLVDRLTHRTKHQNFITILIVFNSSGSCVARTNTFACFQIVQDMICCVGDVFQSIYNQFPAITVNCDVMVTIQIVLRVRRYGFGHSNVILKQSNHKKMFQFQIFIKMYIRLRFYTTSSKSFFCFFVSSKSLTNK